MNLLKIKALKILIMGSANNMFLVDSFALFKLFDPRINALFLDGPYKIKETLIC